MLLGKVSCVSIFSFTRFSFEHSCFSEVPAKKKAKISGSVQVEIPVIWEYLNTDDTGKAIPEFSVDVDALLIQLIICHDLVLPFGGFEHTSLYQTYDPEYDCKFDVERLSMFKNLFLTPKMKKILIQKWNIEITNRLNFLGSNAFKYIFPSQISSDCVNMIIDYMK